MSNVTVKVNNEVVHTFPTCTNEGQCGFTTGIAIQIPLHPPVMGNNVTISRPGTAGGENYLNICEVEVYGELLSG